MSIDNPRPPAWLAAMLPDAAPGQALMLSHPEKHASLHRAFPSLPLRIGLQEESARLPQAFPSFQVGLDPSWQAEQERWQQERWQRVKLQPQTQALRLTVSPLPSPLADIHALLCAYCPGFIESSTKSAPGLLQLHAAQERLLAHLGPWLRNPRALQVLRQRAAARCTSPHMLLRTELFPHAMVMVCYEAATPQRMRIGRDWVTNGHGKVEMVSPIETPMPMTLFGRWWLSQVYAATSAIPCDEAYPRPTTPVVLLLLREELALERLAAPESPGARDSAMLSTLLYDEERDPSEHLHRLFSSTSPRERELLMVLHQGLSRKEAARVMGISRSTVDVLLHRIRKKAQGQ